jgi:gliding motility-associated-like protein
VPNPSFEQHDTCAPVMGICVTCTVVPNWFGTAISSIDYYNTCSNFLPFGYPTLATIPLTCRGYQYPHTGNAYTGMTLYDTEYNLTDTVNVFSEYLSAKLTQPLKSNGCYYAETYVNQSNSSLLAVNQISILLSTNVYSLSSFIFDNSILPQVQYDTTLFLIDTLNCVKVSGNFIAQGGEQYLTIGNFRDGAHLKKIPISTNFSSAVNGMCGDSLRPFLYAYIHVDDVSLYELPNHTGIQSYTLCAGDSLLLGDTTTLPVRYQWSLNNTVIDTTKNIIVKPIQTTTYVLQTKHCTTQTQTITVTVNDCSVTPPIPTTEPTIPNVFTPNSDNINDVFAFKINGTLTNFGVYNRWGLLIKNLELKTTNYISWDGRTTSGEACNEGVYFYVLEYTDANGDVHKKNGYLSLIR